MNLNVPTLLFSMPIQMPIGGLLMMSMMSPTYPTFTVKANSHEEGTNLVCDHSVTCGILAAPHLEFEGLCVVRAGDEVGMDPSSPTELALVGAILLQPQTVSLARAVGLTGHTTWSHKHKITLSYNRYQKSSPQHKLFLRVVCEVLWPKLL